MNETTDAEKNTGHDDTFQATVDAARALVLAWEAVERARLNYSICLSSFRRALGADEWEGAFQLPAVVAGCLIRYKDVPKEQPYSSEIVVEPCRFAEEVLS